MKKKIFVVFLVVALLLSTANVLAYSNGGLDTSFSANSTSSGAVNSISIQPDGKVVIGGAFKSYNGISRNHIARLNADGTLDTTFDPKAGTDGDIFTTSLQVDRKIIIGGLFTSYAGTARSNIARLNSDGTLDTTFDPRLGTNSAVYTTYIQPDGKILIGGSFNTYNGLSYRGIVRLNSDGTLDNTFDPRGGPAGDVYSISLQADGKVIIGGKYALFNTTPQSDVSRLNTDGSLDTSFNPGAGVDGTVYATFVQPDGKIVLAGDITKYNEIIRTGIVRINSNGSIDTTFNPGTGVAGVVNAVSVQEDNKVVIVGNFTAYNGTARSNIARVNSDGTLDTSFNPGAGTNNEIKSIAIQSSDRKAIIGGVFTSFNGTTRNNIARLGDGVSVSVPATPTTVPDMTSATDTGTSNTDNITTDTTPDFTVVCTTGNTVTLYVDNVATSSTATCANNTATITLSTPLTLSSHTISYTERNNIGESGRSPALSVSIITGTTSNDTIAPRVLEIAPVGNTTDTTPNYTFSSDEIGTITYGGPCVSNTNTAVVGFNTVTFNNLFPGYYANCTIRVTDYAGNISNMLTLLPFTITASNQVVTPDTTGCTSVTLYSPITGNRCPTYTGPTTFVDTNPVLCPHFTQYLKVGRYNDPNEVRRWQAFLNQYQNEYLTLDGKFGPLSFQAIKRFQLAYQSEILAPWGIYEPTGYIYKSTRAKANKMRGCSEGTIILDNGNSYQS